MQNSYSNDNYAGFWVRLAAYLIDSIIVAAVLLVVRLFMAGMMAILRNTPLAGDVLFHYTLKDIVLYVFQVMYFVLATYYAGTTVGKRLLNLRVVPADRSDKLTFMDVLYRETVGRFLCSVSICIGYIMIGIDREKRGLHDMLCDTRVVYERKVKVYPVYQRPPVPPMQQVPVPQQQVPPQEQQVSQVQPEPSRPVEPQFPQGEYRMVDTKPVMPDTQEREEDSV